MGEKTEIGFLNSGRFAMAIAIILMILSIVTPQWHVINYHGFAGADYDEYISLNNRYEVYPDEDEDYVKEGLEGVMGTYSRITMILIIVWCVLGAIVIFFTLKFLRKKLRIYITPLCMGMFLMMVLTLGFYFFSNRVTDHANDVIEEKALLIAYDISYGYSFFLFILSIVAALASTIAFSVYATMAKKREDEDWRMDPSSHFKYKIEPSHSIGHEFDFCPICNNELNYQTTPKFCPYCKSQLLK